MLFTSISKAAISGNRDIYLSYQHLLTLQGRRNGGGGGGGLEPPHFGNKGD